MLVQRLTRLGLKPLLVVLAVLAISAGPAASFVGTLAQPGRLLAAAVVVLLLLFLPAPNRWLTWGVAGLLLVGLVAGLAATSGERQAGWLGTYTVGATVEGGIERSSDFLSLGTTGTRVDGALSFHGNEFPAHFLNDRQRFNFGINTRPGRDQLPVTGAWQAVLTVPSDGPRTFRIESVGAAVLTTSKGILGTRAREGPQATEETFELTAGRHPVTVSYTRPEGRVPYLRVFWQPTPGTPLTLLDDRYVGWGSNPLPLPAWHSAAAQTHAIAVLAALALWLGAGLWGLRSHPRRALIGPALMLVPLAMLAYGIAVNAPILDRAVILSGGDDWLTHESMARDIQQNGLLMTEGRTEVEPFYAQPLYPYLLAALHTFLGEGLFGPLVFNWLALGLTAVLVSRLSWRLFGPKAGFLALALFVAFAQQEHVRVARQLLNENLYLPLATATLLALVALSKRRPSWLLVVGTGVLLGLSALTRSQILLYVPFALLVLALAWRRAGLSARQLIGWLAVLVIVTGAVIAPATARNLIVSGKAVLISSSSVNNMLTDHAPPRDFDLDNIDNDALYDALKLERGARVMAEYVKRDPMGYLSTWVPLGAHSIGLTGVRRGDSSVYWGFLLTFLGYLATAVLVPAARRLESWLIHAFVGTHLLTMMMFQADTYGFRLVLPMYGPMIAVLAELPCWLMGWLARLLPEGRRGRVGALVAYGGASVLLTAALVQQGGALLDGWDNRELAFHGLVGQAGSAVRTADRETTAVIYLATGDGRARQFGAGNLPGLQFAGIKWFDPAQAVPIPPVGAKAVYALSELNQRGEAAQRLGSCLGLPDGSGQLVLTGEQAAILCLGSTGGWRQIETPLASAVVIERALVPTTLARTGEADLLLSWRIQSRPRQGAELAIRLRSGSTNGDPQPIGYAVTEWASGERVLSRVALRGSSALPAGPAVVEVSLGGSDWVELGSVELR